MGNKMIGLIISDPFASKFHIQFTMKYGDYIDTIPGISNLGKHMILQSCEKYNYLYPFYNSFNLIKDSLLDSETDGTHQSYYISLPFIFHQKAMDMLTKAFRHPLYSQELIKNEIQVINNEFYEKIKERIGIDIIRQLSSDKTSFNGITCGKKLNLSEVIIFQKY